MYLKRTVNRYSLSVVREKVIMSRATTLLSLLVVVLLVQTIIPLARAGGPLPGCGDGIVDSPEECDEGIFNDDFGTCTSNCSFPVCGDGFLQSFLGEECDNGTANSDTDVCAMCQEDCTICRALDDLSTCGDGNVTGLESCDSGGFDGCSLTDCLVEDGWACLDTDGGENSCEPCNITMWEDFLGETCAEDWVPGGGCAPTCAFDAIFPPLNESEACNNDTWVQCYDDYRPCGASADNSDFPAFNISYGENSIVCYNDSLGGGLTRRRLLDDPCRIRVMCKVLENAQAQVMGIKHCFFYVEDGAEKYTIGAYLGPKGKRITVKDAPSDVAAVGVKTTTSEDLKLAGGKTLAEFKNCLKKKIGERTAGDYSAVSNNSNKFVKDTLTECGGTNKLPPSAPTSEADIKALLGTLKLNARRKLVVVILLHTYMVQLQAEIDALQKLIDAETDAGKKAALQAKKTAKETERAEIKTARDEVAARADGDTMDANEQEAVWKVLQGVMKREEEKARKDNAEKAKEGCN